MCLCTFEFPINIWKSYAQFKSYQHSHDESRVITAPIKFRNLFQNTRVFKKNSKSRRSEHFCEPPCMDLRVDKTSGKEESGMKSWEVEAESSGDERHTQLLNPLFARSRAISLANPPSLPSLIESPGSSEQTAMIAKRLFARFGFNCSLERLDSRRSIECYSIALLPRGCGRVIVRERFLCEWSKMDSRPPFEKERCSCIFVSLSTRYVDR